MLVLKRSSCQTVRLGPCWGFMIWENLRTLQKMHRDVPRGMQFSSYDLRALLSPRCPS